MLKQKYFLTGIFILSAERQPIKLAWRKIVWLHFNAAERIKQEVYGCAQVIFYDKIDPKDVALEEICLQRGIAYWYVDSINKAYSDLNYCIDQKYEVVCSYFWRAYVYWKAGKEKGAYNDFMTVILQGQDDDPQCRAAAHQGV